MSGLRLVERAPVDALRRYLRQRHISLPGAYWREAMQLVAQSIMEVEVSQMIAASRYERRPSRRAYRNGYRESAWRTADGDIPIRIPKLRRGSYYPSFIDKPHIEQTASDFVTYVYIGEVRFEDVAHLLDILNVSAETDQTAALHEGLYDLIADYRARLLDVERVTLDMLPVEERGRRRYLAIAVGDDELLEHDITPEADDAFWQAFIRRIDGRSVRGVEYIAVSRIRHVVRLTDVTSPQALLVA